MQKSELFSLKNYLIELNIDIDQFSSCLHARNDSPILSDVEYYTVILEDRRFFYHRGVDARSVVREIIKLATFRKHGGASTIDMQFVRTVSERYEYTAKRKIRECIISRLLQFQCSKVCILRSYLGMAYFGTGLWGVESASKLMIGKRPSQALGLEAAFIASMLVYPRPRNPSAAWYGRVIRRARYGLAEGSRLEQSFKEIGMR